jgi:GT2 family glycosyltransferase
MTGQTASGGRPVDLSVIIINWKSVQYLGPCLRSVYENTIGLDFEVIVLDNASYDGSAELVRAEFPQVTFIQSEENYGFTKGNNVAFRYAAGDTILLLNPDTEVLQDAIPRLFSRLHAIPDAGAIGCRLLNSDGSTQTTCIQAFPTILNQLLDADLLKRTFPTWSLWGMRPLFRDPGEPVAVEMICGACIMLKKSVFEQVGLLSSEYLMYGDELDLCYKIRHAGHPAYYIGDASVTHHGGKSRDSLRQGLADVWVRIAAFTFLLKTRGWVYSGMYRATLAVAAATRLAILCCTIPFGKGTSSFAKWKRILQWAVGMNGWARVASEDVGLTARSS